MNQKRLIVIWLIGTLCVAIGQSDATIHRFLSRRYALEESTATTVSNETPKQADGQQQQQQQQSSNPADGKPTRLYPDLTSAGEMGSQQAPFGVGIFPQQAGNLPPTMRRPTPFLPFGPAGIPPQNPGPLNANYQANSPFNSINNKPPPEVFSSTLGERLLKLANGGQAPTNATETRRALQNATVLNQLNRGVHSVYDNLAKAYNSTIQSQVELLKNRVRNNTNVNAWQHNWAGEVSQFYKTMADRASHAQENLNAAWNRMRNTNATELQKTFQQRDLMSPFGNLQTIQDDLSSNNFVPRSLNLQPPESVDQVMQSMNPNSNPNGSTQGDLRTQLREFWNTQVRPQMAMAKSTIARTWHDLSANGAYSPFQTGESRISSRNSNNNNMAPQSPPTGDFIDNILSMVNLNGPEYSLIDSDNNTSSRSNNRQNDGLVNTMQNNMINMQREINQLWKGLTNSLQSTMDNMRLRTMMNNKNQKNKPVNPSDMSTNSTNGIERIDQDPAENEISAKLMNLNSLQRDADRVHDAVQRERYNQKFHQDQASVSDRLKNFYNNLRIDENVHKIGNVVNDFWSNIPDRWNNIVSNVRQPNGSTTTTAKPTE